MSRALFSRAMQAMGLHERVPHAWKIWSAAIALAPKVPVGLLENQGERLLELRGNLTQVQAAQVAGVCRNQWVKWEMEQAAPRERQLHGFALKARLKFAHYEFGGASPARGRRPPPQGIAIPRIPKLPRRAGSKSRKVAQQSMTGQGDRLRELRGALSLDQASLVANVSRTTWREWEAEQALADWSMLEGFAERAARRYSDPAPAAFGATRSKIN